MKRYLKLQIFVLLFTTLSLCAQSYTALYRVTGTRNYVPMKIELPLPNNWEIRQSSDPKNADTLATKEKGIAVRMEFFDLTNTNDKEYIQTMLRYGYTHSVVNNRNILTQEEKLNDGGMYLNVRMILGQKALYIPVFPPKGKSLSSLSTEISELTHIIASIKLSSAPDEKALKKATKSKYDAIKKEIDDALSDATLISTAGSLKKVHSFCRTLDVIPFKYSQDKEVPQSVKDYANNASDLCEGKLYASALTKHLQTQGNSICKDINIALQDEFFIKAGLRKSGDIKLWEKLQLQYKTTCPKGK